MGHAPSTKFTETDQSARRKELSGDPSLPHNKNVNILFSYKVARRVEVQSPSSPFRMSDQTRLKAALRPGTVHLDQAQT